MSESRSPKGPAFYLTIGIPCLALAFGLGFLAGSARKSDPPGGGPEKASGKGVPERFPAPAATWISPEGQAGDPDLELLGMKKSAARIRAARSEPEDSSRESLARAKETYDLMIAYYRTADPEVWVKAIGKMDDLDPAGASFFVTRYDACGKDEKVERTTALLLALASGGRDTAAFIDRLLMNPSLPADERLQLLQGLSGYNERLFLIREIPVDGPLARKAFELVASQDALDRQGGAGLLGGVETPASQTILRQLAETDADAQVKKAAIRALGYSGNRETITYLREFKKGTLLSFPLETRMEIPGTIEMALIELRKRYPE